MSVLAAAPVPFIAAATVVVLVLLIVIARAVFAPTDEPARRLCAILATLRRPRSGIEAWNLLLPPQACSTPRQPRTDTPREAPTHNGQRRRHHGR
jgi:hypothetical protein